MKQVPNKDGVIAAAMAEIQMLRALNGVMATVLADKMNDYERSEFSKFLVEVVFPEGERVDQMYTDAGMNREVGTSDAGKQEAPASGSQHTLH